MTLTSSPPPSGLPALDAGQRIVLRNVSWGLYERMLEEVGDSHVRINYFRGVMEIMYPSNQHEGWKKTIARLIEVYAIEADIPLTGLGSVTCRRGDVQAGIEPDECYSVTTPP